MVRRALLPAVLVCLLPSLAFADLLDSIPKAVAAQARPNAKGSNDDNPYFVPSMALLAGGGLVTLIGLTHDTGAKCTSTLESFECGTTKSKATIFAGLGAIGVGTYLFYKGKNQSNHRPEVLIGVQGVSIRQRLTW